MRHYTLNAIYDAAPNAIELSFLRVLRSLANLGFGAPSIEQPVAGRTVVTFDEITIVVQRDTDGELFAGVHGANECHVNLVTWKLESGGF